MRKALKRTGFIHIVEIVIITLVVFVLVTQFTAIPPARADWDEAKLNIQGQELLYSVDAMGINWLDPEEVRDALDPVLQESTLKYSVTVKNAIKSNILVGCVCTNSEFEAINSTLTPFTLNNQDVNFSVVQIDPTSERVSFPVYLDVIVIGNYLLDQGGGLGPLIIDLENYLAEGKSVLEIRDLSVQDFGDFVQGYIFGVKWDAGLPDPTSSRINFAVSPNSTFYSIYKYFRHIPGGINTTVWNGFDNFLDNEKVDRETDGNTEVILRQDGTGVPALIVKEGIVANSGRSAWLSAGDDTAERRILLKALVAWLAGNINEVVPGEIREPASFSIFRVINIDMFQPVEVVLNLGYIF